MGRRDSSANPTGPDRGDSVNPNPGDGASGPGEHAYDHDSQVNVAGGEAEIDMEEKARRMAAGDESADPAIANAAPPEQPNDDVVTENPEVQSGG